MRHEYEHPVVLWKTSAGARQTDLVWGGWRTWWWGSRPPGWPAERWQSPSSSSEEDSPRPGPAKREEREENMDESEWKRGRLVYRVWRQHLHVQTNTRAKTPDVMWNAGYLFGLHDYVLYTLRGCSQHLLTRVTLRLCIFNPICLHRGGFTMRGFAWATLRAWKVKLAVSDLYFNAGGRKKKKNGKVFARFNRLSGNLSFELHLPTCERCIVSPGPGVALSRLCVGCCVFTTLRRSGCHVFCR